MINSKNYINIDGIRFTQGSRVRQFEKEWSEWLGVKHSVFVNSVLSTILWFQF